MKRSTIYRLFFLSLIGLGMVLNQESKAAHFHGVSFQVFYNELSPYGDWVMDPTYGYVWVPFVEQGFHPYGTNGYWEMTNFGNTWVSNYQWGWAPFHYGRWFWDDYLGWAWVPGYEWGPAWVNWRTGGGYYGNTSGYSQDLTLPNSKITIEIPALQFVMNVEPKLPFGSGVKPNYEVIPTINQYINNENISDIEELKSIYLKTIIKKLPSTYLISNENINDDIFNKLGDKKVVKCKEYDNYYRQLYDREYPIVFSEIENEVNPDFNYNERVELIKSKDKNKKNLLQKEIEKLKSEKSEIENWDLKQIFKEVDINQYLNDFTNNGLLRNLILEGYINENYNDYISLFHEVTLTKEDKKFERNVKSGL